MSMARVVVYFGRHELVADDRDAVITFNDYGMLKVSGSFYMDGVRVDNATVRIPISSITYMVEVDGGRHEYKAGRG